MGLRINKDGIYVDDKLEIPANKDVLISGVYENLKQDGLKTIGGEPIIGSGNINVGKVLQIVNKVSPNESYYFNSKDYVELPGLSVVIEPKSKNSYFLVLATINASINYVQSVAIKYRGSFIGYPNSNNKNHPNSLYVAYNGIRNNGYIRQLHVNYAIENNSLEPAEISLYMRGYWNGTSYGFYYNDRSSNDMRSLSNIIVMEVEK